MKQTIICLLKGLLFSALLLALSVLLLAYAMMKTGIGDTVLFVLLLAAFSLAIFLGGRYFAKHTNARRFLWGILFGGVAFGIYLLLTFCFSLDGSLSGHAMYFLAASLLAGCLGGMLS